MKNSILTKVELLPLLVSIVVGLFPGNWSTARNIVFFASLALTIVVACIHFLGLKFGNPKGGTLKKQYLDEFTLGVIREFQGAMNDLADEVAEATKIEDIFQSLLLRVDDCIERVSAIEQITASSGLTSIANLDVLAAKRGLESIRKALKDEFNDFCPHSYIHPVKRPVRVRESIVNLTRIMKAKGQ